MFNSSLGVEIGKSKLTALINNLFNMHYASSLGDNFGVVGGGATNDTHPIYQCHSRDFERYFGFKATVSF